MEKEEKYHNESGDKQALSNAFANYSLPEAKKSYRGTERSDLIKQFYDRVNHERSEENVAIKRQNRSRWLEMSKADPSLTLADFKRQRSFQKSYPKLPFLVFVKALKPYSLHRLYRLFAECQQSQNFSRYFWWKIKNDKEQMEEKLKQDKLF